VILLAFDIGTHLGFAIGPRDGRPRLGTVELRDVRGLGPWLRSSDNRLRALLRECDEVVCERPFAKQDAGAAKNFALLGHILYWAAILEKRAYKGISPMTAKAHFAADGRASKDDVFQAARARGYHPANFNESDACAVWHCQVETDGKLKPKPKKRKAKADPATAAPPPAKLL
jgi:Holliday junction resolvasome RuvABC endonuclease subunit